MVAPSRTLRAPDAVRTLLRHLHPELKKKVKATLETILLDPSHGKALKAELLGLRSVRIGRLRVICRITPAAVDLVAIGPRRTIYEETVRLLRRETEEQMRGSAE
ncbi:MAG: type II toxin-antitoxin system RelE/ParE family toxin [Candidatus Methylomirabilis oxyfera]|nr:type II toxin-antitoxin system RelE/ParE family toxin [Candidatus Methylomirabilis oxyfera]